MNFRLNSINPDSLMVSAAQYGGDKERANIVTVGRMVMQERAGRNSNLLRNNTEYTVYMDDRKYAQTSENLRNSMLMYCAKKACAISGEVAPASWDAFRANARQYFANSTFFAVLSGIIRDIVTPVLPATMSSGLDALCEMRSVPLGQTLEIDVQSNAPIVFQDGSWGASASKPEEQLYSYPITVNPNLYTAKFAVKWYQMVANNYDIGVLFNAIAAGLNNKIVALVNQAMIAGAGSTFYTPSGLVASTPTMANIVNLVKKVAAVNNVPIANVIGYGDIAALSEIVPNGIVNTTAVNLDAAMSTMLGTEYYRTGYIAQVAGARLFPLQNVIVPGTQNTTVTELLPADVVYFMAANGYKPVVLGIEEGTPVDIVLTPQGNDSNGHTADGTIVGTVSISMAAAPVFASKVGKLTV